MKKNEKSIFPVIVTVILYALLSGVFLYLTFCNLNNVSIENWDEARHGISAYEMIQNNNFIENTYNYGKDLWNLKPPLSFWAESASMSIFGYSFFAFRLPSALSFAAMFFAISIFLNRNYGAVSAIAFMAVFNSFGDLFFEHMGRSGDADALFNLFFVLSVIFLFYEKKTQRHIYLYLSGFMFSLAFLSKSFHAVSIMGIIVCFMLLSGEFKKLKLKNYAIFFSASFLPVLIWAFARFLYDGFEFLGVMFGVDVVERTEYASENGFLGFLQNVLSYKIVILILAVNIAAAVLLVVLKKINFRNILNSNALLYILYIAVPSAIYLITKSMAFWYYFPTFIGLILISGILYGRILCSLKSMNGTLKKVTVISVIFVSSAVAVLLARFMYLNVLLVRGYSVNTEQSAIRTLLDGKDKYKSKNTYIYKLVNSYSYQTYKWEQADILTAELYCDAHCKNGDIDNFSSDKDSIMFIANELYEANKTKMSAFSVVSQNSDYKVLYNGT